MIMVCEVRQDDSGDHFVVLKCTEAELKRLARMLFDEVTVEAANEKQED